MEKAFEDGIKNPNWNKVEVKELPGEFQSGRIISAYDLGGGYMAILLNQTWIPYSWHMNRTSWEITHVSTKQIGGTKLPIIGWVGTTIGLLVMIANND